MGNLFIGFPVPRAKIADMITGSAPPTLHKSQHEDGGTDEIDCSGLAGAGGITNLYEGNGIYLGEAFSSLDSWWQETNTGGSISNLNSLIEVKVDGTSGAFARLIKELCMWSVWPNWDKKLYWVTEVEIQKGGDNCGVMWITGGVNVTQRNAGYKIDNGVLRGCVHNGTSGTLTDWSYDMGTGARTRYKRLEVKYKVTSCEFWVDGVLVETLSTGLPSGEPDASYLFSIGCEDNANAVLLRIRTCWFKVWKEM